MFQTLYLHIHQPQIGRCHLFITAVRAAFTNTLTYRHHLTAHSGCRITLLK